MVNKLKKYFSLKVNEATRLTHEPFLFTIILLIGLSLIIFILYPLFEVVKLSLSPQGNLSFDIYKYI